MGVAEPLPGAPDGCAGPADAALAALLVLLVLAAGLWRPVYRWVDPATTGPFDARAAFLAGEEVDPWGQPWVRAVPSPITITGATAVGSMGPDRASGTADDALVGFARDEGARFDPWPGGPRHPYDAGPLALLRLMTGLMLARFLSHHLKRRPPLRQRLATAAGVAGVVWLSAWLALAGAKLPSALEAGLPFLLVPTWLALHVGVYALAFALVFAYRELGDAPPIEVEAGPRSAAPTGGDPP